MLSYRERRRIAEESAVYAKGSTRTEPKQSSWSLFNQHLWGVLNQPFTLWLLSALLLSLWSTYHSAAQQCHEEAEKTLSDFTALLDEIGGRVAELRRLADNGEANIGSANTDVLQIYHGEAGYQSPAYKGHTLRDVWIAYNRLAEKIVAQRLPDLRGENAENLNYEHNLKMDLASLLDNAYAMFVTTDTIKEDWNKIERRRLLIELPQRKIANCSIGTVLSIAAFGYSDGPQWTFD
jgi:hypothetical protein